MPRDSISRCSACASQGGSHVEDQEIFPGLSIVPGDERYVPAVLARSDLVQLVGDVPAQRPDRTVDAGGNRAAGYVSSSADGDDGAPLDRLRSDRLGDRPDGYFRSAATPTISTCCACLRCRASEDVGPSVLVVAARYCKERRALLIVDPPSGWHTADDALLAMRDWNCRNRKRADVFPAHTCARQIARPFRIIRALRRRRRHAGANR